MTTRAERNLARTLVRLTQRITATERSSQAAYRGIHDGAMPVYGPDGELIGSVGLTAGGVGVENVVAEPPAAPVAPTIDAGSESAIVSWSGSFVDNHPTGVVVDRVAVHVLYEDAVTWDESTERTVMPLSGGTIAVYADAGVPIRVLLVAVSAAGVASDPTEAVEIEPLYMPSVAQQTIDAVEADVAEAAEKVAAVDEQINGKVPWFRGPEAPVDPVENTVWIDTDAAEGEPGVLVFWGGQWLSALEAAAAAAAAAAELTESGRLVGEHGGMTYLPTGLFGFGPVSSDPTVSISPFTGLLTAVGAMIEGHIEATTGTLINVSVLGALSLGDRDAGHIMQTPTGIVGVDSDGEVMTTWSAETGQLTARDGVFSGQGTFNGLDVLGNFRMAGLNNFLNGLLSLSNGVTDPGQAPLVAHDYRSVKLAGGVGGVNRRGLAESGNLWVSTDFVFGTGSVHWFTKDGGGAYEFFKMPTGWAPVGGVVHVGDRFYVLASQSVNGGTEWQTSGWRVIVFQEQPSGAPVHVSSFAIGASITTNARPAIGTDGSNLFVAHAALDGRLLVQTFTTAGANTENTLLTSSWGAGSDVTSITRTSVGFAATRWVVSSTGGIFVYSTGSTPGRVAAEEWPFGLTGQIRGLMVGADGQWHGMNTERVVDYTLNPGGPSEFGYTWYDDDTSNGSSTAETKVSPRRTYNLPRFSRVVVSLPSAPPDDGSVDGANTARMYWAPSGSPLRLLKQLAQGELQASFTSLPTNGAAPPVASGFATRPSTSPGRVASDKADTVGPIIDLSGAGGGRTGRQRWDANGAPIDAHGFVRASGQLTATTSFVLIPGLSVTVNSNGPGDAFKVFAVVDAGMGGSSTTDFIAALFVDGTAEPGTIIANASGSTSWRGTVGQNWVVTGLPVGPHVLQIRALKTNTSGTWLARANNSTLLVEHVL